MARKKKRKDTFKPYRDTAIGLGGLGVGLGASSAVAGSASAGTAAAGIMPSFGTIASGAGIATTAFMGKGLLNQVSDLNKKKKRK